MLFYLKISLKKHIWSLLNFSPYKSYGPKFHHLTPEVIWGWKWSAPHPSGARGLSIFFAHNFLKIRHLYVKIGTFDFNGRYLGNSKTRFLKTPTGFFLLNFYPLPLKFGTFLHNYKTYYLMGAFFSKMHIFYFIFFRIFFSRHFFEKIQKIDKNGHKMGKKALIEKIPH